MNWYEYIGAVHIHTSDSDGTKGVEEIVKLAQKVKLDFLLFSDHLTLRSLYANLEGWYDSVLAIVGYEIHDEDNKNHYLVFNLNEVLPFGLPPAEYVREVKEKGGIGIIAHPDEARNSLKQFPPYPWTDWEMDGFDGIEIWNEMSEWMENLTRTNQLKMIFSPRKALKSPTDRTLRKWDEINQKRKMVGIGAIDAHAFSYPLLGLFRITIFPYDVQFKSIRTHILLTEPLSSEAIQAKKQVLNALKECRVFVSNYRWGDAKGFSFVAQNSTNKVMIGENIEMKDGVKLFVQTPSDCYIKLLCDGKTVAETQSRMLEFTAKEKGNYRVEAYKNRKGWIYSNHIRIN
jgi:hypothetical protein